MSRALSYKVRYHHHEIDGDLYVVVDSDGFERCAPIPHERARAVKYALDHPGLAATPDLAHVTTSIWAIGPFQYDGQG